MAQIQGKDTRIVIYQNGSAISGITATSFQYEADSEIRVRDLLGKGRTENQLIVNGFTGTINLDISSERLLEITDLINAEDKSGIKTFNWDLQVTENYHDGSRARYRLVNVTFNIPQRNTAGRTQDSTATWTFRAEDFALIR